MMHASDDRGSMTSRDPIRHRPVETLSPGDVG
jgi:hypothetical protein